MIFFLIKKMNYLLEILLDHQVTEAPSELNVSFPATHVNTVTPIHHGQVGPRSSTCTVTCY
jgi:hypothetical protein